MPLLASVLPRRDLVRGCLSLKAEISILLVAFLSPIFYAKRVVPCALSDPKVDSLHVVILSSSLVPVTYLICASRDVLSLCLCTEYREILKWIHKYHRLLLANEIDFLLSSTHSSDVHSRRNHMNAHKVIWDHAGWRSPWFSVQSPSPTSPIYSWRFGPAICYHGLCARIEPWRGSLYPRQRSELSLAMIYPLVHQCYRAGL